MARVDSHIVESERKSDEPPAGGFTDPRPAEGPSGSGAGRDGAGRGVSEEIGGGIAGEIAGGGDAAARSAADRQSAGLAEPVTLRTIARWMREDRTFACLTCYDYTTAKWLQRAGVPVLLVGDTAAEMVLGYPSTIHAPLDVLIALTAAVKRGAPNAMVMADMPFMSYQPDDAEALRNAGRFMTEGLADTVKLEVDGSHIKLIERMARAGVPVVAHIGSRPQQHKLTGGYRSTGKTAAEARQLIEDAVALEEHGATMLLIEATPEEVSQKVVERLSIPVIGCGAGRACHGQIVVLHDLLGLTDWQPSFARPLAHLGRPLTEAASQWVQRVGQRDLGEHPYRMNEEERKRLEEQG